MDISQAYQSDVLEQIQSKNNFSDTQLEETIDLLDNLGYVAFEKNNSDGVPPSSNEISIGIKTFRAELRNSILNEPLAPSDNKLSEFELDFLANLSDLEGRFKLADHYAQYRTDVLLIRVLKFRLHILGQIEKVDHHFDQEMNLAMDRLKEITGIKNHKTLLSHLDDFDVLIRKIASIESSDDFHNMVFFNYAKKSHSYKDQGLFKNYLWMVPEPDRRLYEKEFFEKAKLNKKSILHIEKISNHPMNELILRLIQIKLWLVGCYAHRIDGEMKAFSVDSLENLYMMIDSVRENGYEDFVDPHKYVFKLSNGYWALNYKYLLLYGIPNTEKDYEDKATDTKALTVQIQNLIDKVDTKKDKDLLIKAVHVVIEKDKKEVKKRRKRKYRKAKGFMRNTISFFKKIGRLISGGIKKVIKAIKDFFNWVKIGITYLIREIKEAFEKMAIAFKFLFSKRIIQTGKHAELVSDFDLDFDVVSVAKSDLTREDKNAHIAKIDKLLNAIEGTFGILGVAIPIIISLSKGPTGWIQTGLKLVRVLLNGRFDFHFQPVLRILT